MSWSSTDHDVSRPYSHATRARKASSMPDTVLGTSFHTVAASTGGTSSVSCDSQADAVIATQIWELDAYAHRTSSHVSEFHLGAVRRSTGIRPRCSTQRRDASGNAAS